MDNNQKKIYRCKKPEKLECSTINVSSINWETNCMGNKRKNLSPQELCRCLKYKPPPPPGCINNYPPKKGKRKKKTNGAETVRFKLDKEQSKNVTESNTDQSINPTTTYSSNATTSISNVKYNNKSNTNTSVTRTEMSTSKNSYSTEVSSKSNTNSSTTTSIQQSGNDRTTQKLSSNETSDSESKKLCCIVEKTKEVEYIEYKGIGKRRRHRNDYMTGPPLPVILDTTPNYYAKVDAQKTTCGFYCNYLNCKLWKEHLPKPPILIGGNIHHLHCFVNEDDFLYKYLKQKEELEQRKNCRDKKK